MLASCIVDRSRAVYRRPAPGCSTLFCFPGKKFAFLGRKKYVKVW